ncbi:MAG: hypothetical protein LBB68_02730 [Treponema sp.]|jgi:hypothetical protein|nr:hypothetical protein [Treponema sp.]
MAHHEDWLPSREQDFADLCKKWKAGLEAPAVVSAFGWNQADCTAAAAKIDAFLTALDAYGEDDSSKNRLTKNEDKEAAKSSMRDFANTNIRYNKKMSDADKLDYGIHPADRSGTAAGDPETYPEAEADTSVMRQVTIRFWDSASKKRGKPHGVHGAEIRWAVLDRPPVSEKEIVNSDFDTASPFTLRFDESDRGRRLYFCLRWESTTNLKGPFGEIYSAVIP